MNRPLNMTEKEWKDIQKWIKSRPKKVQAVIEHLPPWGKYRMKETGQIGHLYSYEQNKDGTVTVKFDTTDIFGILPLRVFGVSPDDLERIDQ